MERITEIASKMSWWQYLLLYVLCFIAANGIACIDHPKSKNLRESIVAVLALFGGMLAVAFVTCRLQKNPGVLILAVLSIPAGIIGYSGTMTLEECNTGLSKWNKVAKKQEAEQKKQIRDNGR